MEPIIKVDNVSMCFNLSKEKHESLKEYFLAMVQGRLQYDEFYALKDVSLDIMPGDFYGLVGLNGSGKSTLLNRLTGADIPANNRLFDTLDTTTRTLEISDTCTVLLSDTVGFIRKLPHHLVEAFKATLEELSYADLLLHVIDASNPLWREQAAVVEQLIVELGAEQTPRIDVFNKCDKFTGDILPHGADIVSISAKTGQGLDELLEKIGGRLDTGACRVVLRLPYDQGGVVDMLHRQAKVERVDYGEAIEVEAVCTPVQLGRLKDYIVSGWTPPKEPWED